ncbi:papain-like cysteine protease family protein [Klebsiella quasipneumoniae]|uniref:papain-like cysteine protease family protein n=1 Tax=Klebsiella quasipneumoniae TaxID=1463165 RepID=UPI00345B41C6
MIYKAFILYLLFIASVRADVNLNVPHFMQNTPVWCWAAAAQQIIAYKKGIGNTPSQCQIVEVATGLGPGECCLNNNPLCYHGAGFNIVANVISYFGGAYSNYVLPANPYVIESTLATGRPILAQLAMSGGGTHVVVIRGIRMLPAPALIVNDPLMIAPMFVPFINLASIWMDGIVIN